MQLQVTATNVAKNFVQNPNSMEAASSPDESHVLFTVTPDEDRSTFTLRVTTPYLRDLVREEITKFDAAYQASFYQLASDLPQFQATLGYI